MPRCWTKRQLTRDGRNRDGAMKYLLMMLALSMLSACSTLPPPASRSAPLPAAPKLASEQVPADAITSITADFAALPGKAGFLVEKLNDGAPNQLIAAHNSGDQFAIASTFKLYILAELADQVKSGQRSWGDVAPLSQRSFSSQATRNWPKDVPVTLATLALQMISLSDNSAADTLLHLLGRTAVEKRLALIGHGAPDKALPFLSTVEAFALKSPGNAALRNRYLAAGEAKQREIIESEQSKLGFAQVDDQAFAAGPSFIDTIEWFASPNDMANLLDNIRLSHNDRMMEIMAVNSGLSPD